MSAPSMTRLAEEYLSLRRKLGFALKATGSVLLNFARYADRSGHQGPVTIELAVRWAKLPQGADPLWWALRLDVVRGFARHRSAADPRTEIPPPGLLGPSHRRRNPYIYSEGELAALLGAAGNLPPVDGLRPHTYSTLLGLLSSTGLRVSEALRLDRAHVDLRDGVLTIVATKFSKSRLVPLHPSTKMALLAYAERRDRHHPLMSGGPFFASAAGTPLRYRTVHHTFDRLRRTLGWAGERGRRPRIHDLRHTFACRRLLAWCRDGSEIHSKVPALSVYLGHVSVSDTYWYLTGMPELMAIASARFEASQEVR